jgi:hypothetical protein
MLFVISAGCEDIPRKDYEDFKRRAESLRQPPPELSEDSQLYDITGLWLVNARLNAGIDLGLRVRFSTLNDSPWPSDEAGLKPTTLKALIWLERNDPLVDPPILEVETNVSEEGRFELVANPLALDPESLGLSSEVLADVVLSTQTLSADALCGDATGSVTVPLTLNLNGSTFYAQRDDDLTLTLAELPGRCPAGEGEDGGAEAGTEAGVMGGEAGVMGGVEAGEEVERPASPDLSDVSSQLGDLTGHWLVNVQTSVIPLKLWASLIFTPSPDGQGGAVVGALRRETDPFDAPPLVTFNAPVDAEGRFEVWLPSFELMGAISVQADLLISALTLPPSVAGEAPEGWCGAGAGQVSRPVPLNLEGSTLYAHPWTPGEPLPEPLLSACP